MNAKGCYTLLYNISRGVWSEDSSLHKTTPQKKHTKLLICFVIFLYFCNRKAIVGLKRHDFCNETTEYKPLK